MRRCMHAASSRSKRLPGLGWPCVQPRAATPTNQGSPRLHLAQRGLGSTGKPLLSSRKAHQPQVAFAERPVANSIKHGSQLQHGGQHRQQHGLARPIGHATHASCCHACHTHAQPFAAVWPPHNYWSCQYVQKCIVLSTTQCCNADQGVVATVAEEGLAHAAATQHT